MVIGLGIILVLVLVLPFAFHKVEENLEAFLFVMGALSVLVSGVFSPKLVLDALTHPIAITAAVLAMGLLFRWTRKPIESGLKLLLGRMSFRLFVFLVILVLGAISSLITVIIASLVLVEIMSILRLDRRAEVRIVILACFATGLGAALTPIGEPLSTIAIGKLRGEPFEAGFWFLMDLLAIWVFPGILAFAAASLFLHGRPVKSDEESLAESPEEVRRDESLAEVFTRAFKVYLFVMALVLLGEGFKPFIDRYVIHLPALALYWINMVSAVLDNATLTAAELSPQMDLSQIRDILLGLLISGGMLIPGNIPNIIAASKLKIGMKEWAKFGVPVGLITMAVYFVVLVLVPGDKPPAFDAVVEPGGTEAVPLRLRVNAGDDRGIADIYLRQDGFPEEVQIFKKDRPRQAEALFPLAASRFKGGHTTIEVTVVDSSGHRVAKQLTVRGTGQ